MTVDELWDVEYCGQCDEFYVCMSCGHEDDPDYFGTHCPNCGVNLDELEEEMSDDD